MRYRHIIIPGTGTELIRAELATAFLAAGFTVSLPHPDVLFLPGHEHSLACLLENGPALLLSVNGQGLYHLKQTLHMLKAAKSTAAIWFVDNPWNILSAVRSPDWKGLPLFVTDASFVPDLARHGAQHSIHLPLATNPSIFSPSASLPPPPPAAALAPIVFVGRSAFPDKASFFAGMTVPNAPMEQAKIALLAGKRPHLRWWIKHMKLTEEKFWPGKKMRVATLGAEMCTQLWRRICLEACATIGMETNNSLTQPTPSSPSCDVFGDSGWQPLLSSSIRLNNPVDYYTELPYIYQQARYVLNVTSLQLSEGLNQRHFDVWMAGGICLTDATPGLALFPKELTEPILYRKPSGISDCINGLEKSNRATLVAQWQQEIRAHHTYEHRAAAIIKSLK